VCDVTKYVDDHPGGPVVLQGKGGKDATKSFNDVSHTEEAIKKMLTFKIGEVDPSSKPLAGQHDS
jgi:cytochrome b involved in lipid metabolism